MPKGRKMRQESPGPAMEGSMEGSSRETEFNSFKYLLMNSTKLSSYYASDVHLGELHPQEASHLIQKKQNRYNGRAQMLN